MKYSQATTVWFLINTILLIPDAVLSHDDKTPWVVASEKPWWNYSQDPPSSPIGTLNQSKDQIAEISCISANPSIFDILEETKEHCKGTDYKVTFYLQNEEDYIRLDSFFIDKCSFNNVLLKYKDWSLTSDKIDLRAKQKIKDAGKTKYRDKVTENKLNQNLNPSLQNYAPYRKFTSYGIPTEYDRTRERQATDSIYIYDDETYENQDAGADIFNQNARKYIHMKPSRNSKQNNYQVTENVDKPSTSKKVNALLDKIIKSDKYGTGYMKENDMQRNKISTGDYSFNTNKKEKISSADQNLLLVDDVSDLKISEVIDLLFNDNDNLNKDTPITFVLNPGIPDTVNSHESNKYSIKNTPRNLDDSFWVSGISNGMNDLVLGQNSKHERNRFAETVDTNVHYYECPDTETNKNPSIATSDNDSIKYRYHILPKNFDYKTKDSLSGGDSVIYMSPGPIQSLPPYSKTGRVPEDQDNYYITDEIPHKFETYKGPKTPQKLYNSKINLKENSEPYTDTNIRHIHPCTSNLGTIDCQSTKKDNYIELEYVQPSVQQSQPVKKTIYPHIYHKPDTDQIAPPRIKLQSKHPILSNVCRNQLPQNLERETINRDIFESGNLSPIPIYESQDKTPSASTSGLSNKSSIKLSQLNFMPSYGPFSPYTITLPQTDVNLHPPAVNEPITPLLPIQPPMMSVTDPVVQTNFTPLYKTNLQTKTFKKILDTPPKVNTAPNENLESSGPLWFSTSNPATKDTVIISVKEPEPFPISILPKEATPYIDLSQTSPISKKQYLKNPFLSPTSHQSDLSALHSANPYYSTSRNNKNEMTNFEFGPQDLSISEKIKPLELPVTTSSFTPTNVLPISRPTTSDIMSSPFFTPQTSTHLSSSVPPLSTYKPNWFAGNKLTQFSQLPEPRENSQSSVYTSLPTRTFPENFQDSNLKTPAVSSPLINKPLTYASKLNVAANKLISYPQTKTPTFKASRVNPYITPNPKITVSQLASPIDSSRQEYTDVFLVDVPPNPDLNPIITTSLTEDKVNSIKPSTLSLSSPSKYSTPLQETFDKISPSDRDMGIPTIALTSYSRPLIEDNSLTPEPIKTTPAFKKVCPVTSPKFLESAYISPVSKIPPTKSFPTYSELLPAYFKPQLKLPYTGLSYEKNILQTSPMSPTQSYITPISPAVAFNVPNSSYSFPYSLNDKKIYANSFQFSNPLSKTRYASNLKSIPYSEPLTTTATPGSYLIPSPASANPMIKKDLIHPTAAHPPISPCSAYTLSNMKGKDFSVLPTHFTSPLWPNTGKSFESGKSKSTLPCRTSTVSKNFIPISASPIEPLKVSATLPIFNPIATMYPTKIPYPNLRNTLTASYTTSGQEFPQKTNPCSLKSYKPHSGRLNDNKHYQTMLPSTTAPLCPPALYSPVKDVLEPTIPLNYKNIPNRSISPTRAQTIFPVPLIKAATAPLLDKEELPLKLIPFTDPILTTKSPSITPSINQNNYQTISPLKLSEPSTTGRSPKYKYVYQPKPTDSFSIIPKATGASTPLLKEKYYSWPYISNSVCYYPIQTAERYQTPASSVIKKPYIIHECPSLSSNEDLNNKPEFPIKSQQKSPKCLKAATDTIPIALTYNPQIDAKYIPEIKSNYYYSPLKNGISGAKSLVSSTPISPMYDSPLTYTKYKPRLYNNEASFIQQPGDFTHVSVTLDPLPCTKLQLLDSKPSVTYTATLPPSIDYGKAFSPITSSSLKLSQRPTIQEFPTIQLPKNMNYPCKHQAPPSWTPNSYLANPLKTDYRYLNSPRTLKPLEDVTPLSNNHNAYYVNINSVRPSLESQTKFTTPVSWPSKFTTPAAISPVDVTPITNRYNTLSSPVTKNLEPILQSFDNKLKYYYTPSSHAKLVTPQFVTPTPIVANVPKTLSLPEVTPPLTNTDPQSCPPYRWTSSPQMPKSIPAVSNIPPYTQMPVTYALPKIVNSSTGTLQLPLSVYQSTPLSPIFTPQVCSIESPQHKTLILPATSPASKINSRSQPMLPISAPWKYTQPSNYKFPASIPIKSICPSKTDTQFDDPLQYSHSVQSLPYSIPQILPTPKQPIHIPILSSVPQAIPFKSVQSVPTSTNSVPLTYTPIDSQQYLTYTTPNALQYKYQNPASSISAIPVHQLTNNIQNSNVYQPDCGTVLAISDPVTPYSTFSPLKSSKPTFIDSIVSPNIMTYQSPLLPPIAPKVTSSYTSPANNKHTSPSWYVPLKLAHSTPPYAYPISIKPLSISTASKTISELESPTLSAIHLMPPFLPMGPLSTSPLSYTSITPNSKPLSPIYGYYKKPILSPTFINSPTNANIPERKPSSMPASSWLQTSKLPLEVYEPISTSISPNPFSAPKNHSPEDLHNAQYTTLLYPPKLQLPFIKPQSISPINTKLLPNTPEIQYSSPNTFSVPSKTSTLLAPVSNAYSPLKNVFPLPRLAQPYSLTKNFRPDLPQLPSQLNTINSFTTPPILLQNQNYPEASTIASVPVSSTSSPLTSLSKSDSLHFNNEKYSFPSFISPFIINPSYYYNPTYATFDPKQGKYICTKGINIPMGKPIFSQHTPKYITKPSTDEVPTSTLKLTPRKYKEYINTQPTSYNKSLMPSSYSLPKTTKPCYTNKQVLNTTPINKLSALTPNYKASTIPILSNTVSNTTPISRITFKFIPYSTISPNSGNDFTPITNAQLPSLTSSDHKTTQSASLTPTYNVIGTSPKTTNVPFGNIFLPSLPVTKAHSELSIPNKLPPPVKFVTPLYKPASFATYSLPCPMKQTCAPFAPLQNTPTATKVYKYNPLLIPVASKYLTSNIPVNSLSSSPMTSTFHKSNPSITQPLVMPLSTVPPVTAHTPLSYDNVCSSLPVNRQPLITYSNLPFPTIQSSPVSHPIALTRPVYMQATHTPLTASKYVTPTPVLTFNTLYPTVHTASKDFGSCSSKSSSRINPFIPSAFIHSDANLPTVAEPFLPKKVIPSIGKTSSNYLSPTTPYNFKSLMTYYNPDSTGSLNNVNICNPIYELNWKYPLLNAATHSSLYPIPEPVVSRWGEIPATPKTEPSLVDINDSKFKTYPLQSSYDSSNLTLQYLPYNNNLNYKKFNTKNDINTSQIELKTKLSNYINNNEKIKSDLYKSNAELSIPLGNILVAKKDSTNSVVYTINPSVDLKMWPSSFKIVEAKLELKLKDVNVRNFQPVLKTLNSYDIKEIENLVKDYIQNKYGNVIVVRGNSLLNDEYDAIKTCSNTCGNKCNLLWPVDTLGQQGKTVQYQRGFF